MLNYYLRTYNLGRWCSQAGDTRIPLPRKSLWTPRKKTVDCKVGLCTSLRTVAELLQQYPAYILQIQRQSGDLNKSNFAIGWLTNQQTISPASNAQKSVLSWSISISRIYPESLVQLTWLTVHNWQKWKSIFLTCPCHKIYREEAVGLKSSNYALKITIFVNMWNLGQFCKKMIYCQ